MKKATKFVITALTEGGHRITKARTRIVNALAAASRPLTITELTQLVDVDEASVYRTIATLHKKELVEEITIKGSKSRFALTHGHHHHAICRGCGLIEHVACTAAPAAPRSLKNFAAIDDHDVTFYGLCTKCV